MSTDYDTLLKNFTKLNKTQKDDAYKELLQKFEELTLERDTLTEKLKSPPVPVKKARAPRKKAENKKAENKKESDDESPKKKARTTKVKYPNAPKRINAYNIFVQRKIAEIKKENPDINHKEAFRKAGLEWKELGEVYHKHIKDQIDELKKTHPDKDMDTWYDMANETWNE